MNNHHPASESLAREVNILNFNSKREREREAAELPPKAKPMEHCLSVLVRIQVHL